MYGTYTADGYTFDNECDWLRYNNASDPENCTGWGGANPENYGGYKDDPEPEERDTREYNNKQYSSVYACNTYEKDKMYYYDDFEEFEVIHETEKAYLLSDDSIYFWCPKSLIKDTTKVKNSIRGRVWKNVDRKDVRFDI